MRESNTGPGKSRWQILRTASGTSAIAGEKAVCFLLIDLYYIL